MKQERVILSFIMVLIGLLVAGAAFYFYQSTKNVSSSTTNIITAKNTPTPTPSPKIYLTLNQFADEQVVSDKTFKISGKTNYDATVIIITDGNQEVLQPSTQGDFSTTITLSDDQNIIQIMSILPGGETTSIQRTVTYSTEDF
jgi:hypothetical protein